MKLIVNDDKNQSIDYKTREQLDFSIVSCQEIINQSNIKSLIGVAVDESSKLNKLLIEKNELDLGVYLIENMLLMNFEDEAKHYCFYPLQEEYIKELKNSNSVNFVITKNNKIDYHFNFTIVNR